MWLIFFLAAVAAVVFMVRLYKSGFTVNKDDFRKTVWINSNKKGGSSALGMQYWLRAFYVEGNLGRIQLYCVSREKDWKFYKSATGEDSTELEFISVDKDVADANVNVGGSVDTIEKFSLNIPVEYLRKMAEKDWKIKVYGKRGHEVITVKQRASSEFLAVLDKVDKDPKALTDGSIKGSGFGRLVFSALAILIAFLALLIFLGVTHKGKDASTGTPISTAIATENNVTDTKSAGVESDNQQADCDPNMDVDAELARRIYAHDHPKGEDEVDALFVHEPIDKEKTREEIVSMKEACLQKAGGAAKSKYVGMIVKKGALPDGLEFLNMNDYFPAVPGGSSEPVAYVASVFNKKETMLWLLSPHGGDYKIIQVVQLPAPDGEPTLETPGICSYPKATDPYVFFALVNSPTDVNELTSTQFLTDIEKAWSIDGDNGNYYFKEVPSKGIICNNSAYGV